MTYIVQRVLSSGEPVPEGAESLFNPEHAISWAEKFRRDVSNSPYIRMAKKGIVAPFDLNDWHYQVVNSESREVLWDSRWQQKEDKEHGTN